MWNIRRAPELKCRRETFSLRCEGMARNEKVGNDATATDDDDNDNGLFTTHSPSSQFSVFLLLFVRRFRWFTALFVFVPTDANSARRVLVLCCCWFRTLSSTRCSHATVMKRPRTRNDKSTSKSYSNYNFRAFALSLFIQRQAIPYVYDSVFFTWFGLLFSGMPG